MPIAQGQMTIVDLTDKSIIDGYPKPFYKYTNNNEEPSIPNKNDISTVLSYETQLKDTYDWKDKINIEDSEKYLYQVIIYAFSNGDYKVLQPTLIYEKGEDGLPFTGIESYYTIGNDETAENPPENAEWTENLKNTIDNFKSTDVIWEKRITYIGEDTEGKTIYLINWALTQSWRETVELKENKSLDGNGFITMSKDNSATNVEKIRIGQINKEQYDSWNIEINAKGIILKNGDVEVGSFKGIENTESDNKKDIDQTTLASNEIISNELKFRYKNNETNKYNGVLGMVAQSNGHVSFKEV